MERYNRLWKNTARDRLDERDGRRIKLRSSKFSELRTQNFELQIAPFPLVSHVPRADIVLESS
jgi:hypothetical protein